MSATRGYVIAIVTALLAGAAGCTAILGDGHYYVDASSAAALADAEADGGEVNGNDATTSTSCSGMAQRCSGKNVQTCNASGQWTTASTCPLNCSGQGVCTGACMPGAKQCEANGIQTCDSTGTWQNSSTCSFGCTNGQCTGKCVPGTNQCSGEALQTCDNTGTWQTDMTCPFVCSATPSPACTGSCVPNSSQCVGSTPQNCDMTGTWQSLPACVQPSPDCGANGCTCNETMCAASNTCTDTTTDTHNCGSCGHDCQGAACQASVCQPSTLSSTGSKEPYAIAVNATNVFWSDIGNGTINSAPLAGGTVTTLATGQSNAMSIALDANKVYWVTTVGGGTVMECGLEGCGGAPTALATGQGSPWGIAVDPTSAYWTASTSASRAPLADGGVVTLGSESKTAYPIAVDPTSAYWSDSVGSILKCALSGCGSSPTTLATSLLKGPAYGIALDAANVYWTDVGEAVSGTMGVTGTGTLNKVSKTGTGSTTLVYGQSNPLGVAVDTAYVYWANSGAGTILKVPVGGGTTVTEASGQGTPAGVAVDATFVYWTNESGSVMRVVK